MRIAQVAPLFESVPPKLYGGIERVVSYLTEELVQQGHEVTLFASGDSGDQGPAGGGMPAFVAHEQALRGLVGASNRDARTRVPTCGGVRHRAFSR